MSVSLKKTFLIPGLFGILVFCQSASALGPVRSLLQENRLDEATAICRQFEVLSTPDLDNFLACAWVYYRTDRLDSAEKMMERIRRSGSVQPEYSLLAAYSQMKKKQYESARKNINTLAEEHRAGALGLATQELSAELYESTGQLDTAAFIYKQMISDDPSRARAHWGLGRYYLAKGDLSRAKTHLELTAKLWPKHLGSRFNLGVVHLQANALGEAAKWLADCYRLNRADSGVLEQLGILFEKKAMIPEAIKYWQRAQEVAKDSTIARDKLAQYTTQVIDTLVEAKQYDQALATLDSYGKTMMKEPKLILRRGVILRNLGKYDKAVRDLVSYSLSNSKDPLASRELGICYVNLKQLEQASNSFARAIELEQNNGLNYAWYAYVMESRGKLIDAREAWRRALPLLNEGVELEKANRRLAAVERRLAKEGRMPAQGENQEFGRPKESNRRGEPPAASGVQAPRN